MREKQGRLHNETCAWRREDASPNCVCCSYFYWSSAKPHRWSVSIASYQSNDIGSILTKVRLLNKKVNVAIRLNSCILKCILLHWCHKDEENEIEGLSVKITSLLVRKLFFFGEEGECGVWTKLSSISHACISPSKHQWQPAPWRGRRQCDAASLTSGLLAEQDAITVRFRIMPSDSTAVC